MKISEATIHLARESAGPQKEKAPPAQADKLKYSAKELEGLFLGQVVKAMRSTIPKESGQSSTMVDMMFSSVMGKSMAEQGGIGLAEFFFKSLSEDDTEAIERLKVAGDKVNSVNLNITKAGGNYE